MPNEMEVDTENMAERVQRAMIESSLAQGAGAYSSNKKRSAMDELYMDLKGLQLTKAGMPPENASNIDLQQQQQQAFNWEQAHLEWERAQHRAAAQRSNSSGLPAGGSKQASFATKSARSASSTSSSSLQQWSGMSASGTAASKAGGPSHRQAHLPPTTPKPSAHFSLPPPQPSQTQPSREDQREPSSPSSACDAGDQVETAGPSTSRWGAFQAKTKGALQKVNISRSGSKGQQRQQQSEAHKQEALQPATEHEQGRLDDDPDVLPHHRRHCSQHQSPAGTPSASFSSKGSGSARAPRPGLSSSLALPTRGTEQGGVLGRGSFRMALELFFGDSPHLSSKQNSN